MSALMYSDLTDTDSVLWGWGESSIGDTFHFHLIIHVTQEHDHTL